MARWGRGAEVGPLAGVPFAVRGPLRLRRHAHKPRLADPQRIRLIGHISRSRRSSLHLDGGFSVNELRQF